MSVNVANLELAMMEKINNSSTELELLTYQKVLERLRTGSVKTASTFSLLPSAAENRGQVYFIESEEAIYFSTGSLWVSITNTAIGLIYEFGNRPNFSIVLSPVQESTSDTNWAFIHAEGYGRRYLKQNGTLWSLGSNCCGGLGLGSASSVTFSSPVQEITSSSNWCVVSSGYNFPGAYTHGIKTDGTMWSWGFAYNGSLGRYAGTSCSPSQIVDTSCDWLDVKSNEGILSLKKNNTLWVWGHNYNGNLGTNNTVCYSSPVQEITSSANWINISSGRVSSAVKSDGSLWSWGSFGVFGPAGAIGDNANIARSSPVREITSSSNWCYVSTGYVTVGIKTDGTLWAWGCDNIGRIGNNTVGDRSSPVQEITSSTNWVRSCSSQSVLAIKTDGTLWGWGHNGTCLSTYCGNLGDGTGVDRSSPVQEFTSSTSWDSVATAIGTVALDLTSL